TTVWISDIVSVEMENGEPTVLRGFLIDVTDRKEEEAELARVRDRLLRSDQRFHAIAMTTADLLFDFDAPTEKVHWFGNVKKMTGYEPEELDTFAVWESHLHPDDHDRVVEHANRVLESGEAFIDTYRIRTAGGDYRWWHVRTVPTASEGDQPARWCGTVTDVTRQKEQESAIRESERRLRLMADSLPVLIAYVDAEQRYQLANQAYEEWFGIPPSEVIGCTIREIMGEEAYQIIGPKAETALSGQTVTFEAYVVAPDGRARYVDASYVPHIDDSGEVLGFFALVRDTTEQVLAEEAARRNRDELAHVLRVATMGELATSVAHELNQPLSAIAANSQAARRFLGAETADIEEAIEALADITSDAKRAGRVIRRMRDLLMKRKLERRPVDVNDAIRNVTGLLHSDAISHHVTVTLDLGDGLPTTLGDRTQLEQVILNLMVNAFEAMTSNEIGRRYLVVRTSIGDAGSTEITVSDNGPGFQAGTDHIFEPFVTTKANGLGMGLSISRSIIDAHGGRLEAVHEPDGGATFHITLPAGGEDS
ncbi:MAG: PAS domain S-box protein, partial [Gemmatimonadales bacterium]